MEMENKKYFDILTVAGNIAHTYMLYILGKLIKKQIYKVNRML